MKTRLNEMAIQRKYKELPNMGDYDTYEKAKYVFQKLITEIYMGSNNSSYELLVLELVKKYPELTNEMLFFYSDAVLNTVPYLALRSNSGRVNCPRLIKKLAAKTDFNVPIVCSRMHGGGAPIQFWMLKNLAGNRSSFLWDIILDYADLNITYENRTLMDAVCESFTQLEGYEVFSNIIVYYKILSALIDKGVRYTLKYSPIYYLIGCALRYYGAGNFTKACDEPSFVSLFELLDDYSNFRPIFPEQTSYNELYERLRNVIYGG